MTLPLAVHKVAKEHAAREQITKIGTVISISPLTVELMTSHLEISEDDGLMLAQWMTYYNQQWGIAVDDVAVLHKHEDQWVLADLVSDTGMA